MVTRQITESKILSSCQSPNTLKNIRPNSEHYILCRKPISEKTVAANVLKHGTGGINIDQTRIKPSGRFPANLILDEEAGQMLDEQTGMQSSRFFFNVKHDTESECRHTFVAYVRSHFKNILPMIESTVLSNAEEEHVGQLAQNVNSVVIQCETCTTLIAQDLAATTRFLYCAKASKSERNLGCESNGHPTIKPLKLMRYLCKLVTPPGGVVLDPFMGSGSTGVAAYTEGFSFIGIERESEYIEIAKARIYHAFPELKKEYYK